jgi:hypothetical protein
MKAIDHKISSVTHCRKFMPFDEPSIEIKSDYDFTKNWSQYYRIDNKKIKERPVQVMSSINTLSAYQVEIEKLKNKVTQLQYEKSILVKWINFLY